MRFLKLSICPRKRGYLLPSATTVLRCTQYYTSSTYTQYAQNRYSVLAWTKIFAYCIRWPRKKDDGL